jgi:hypothetical protein
LIVYLREDLPKPKRRPWFWRAWAYAWSTPRGYRASTALARAGWRVSRRHPEPPRETFRQRWEREHR